MTAGTIPAGHGRECAVAESTFGPYRLVARLGAGGMGEVWRALDTRKRREVALKLIRADAASDQGFVARFHREAELAARLSSPYIVPIHDYGQIDGQLFLDMALVDGVDLGELLDREHRLAADRAVRLIGQVARALGVAHRAGLVHRDVKPSNVLVTDDDGDDHAYLIDFGIATALEGTRLTQSGAILGTLGYMAPERFAGHGDHRSDVYALTCLLYEVLTGEQPYVTDSTAALIYAHLHTRPPSVSERTAVPVALDLVVARGMAKDPAERFPSTSELAMAARAALATPAPPSARLPQTGPVPSSDGPVADGPTAPAPAPAEPPSGRRPDTQPGLPAPPNVLRVVVAVVAVVVVLAAAGGLARLWVLQNYYVGADGTQVTIFQGVRGAVLGLPLHEVAEHTDITVDDLTASDRNAVDDGILATDGLDGAHGIVQRLRDRELKPCGILGGDVPGVTCRLPA